MSITDDAQVWNICNDAHISVVEGDYENIKVTTKSDLEMVVKYVEKDK